MGTMNHGMGGGFDGGRGNRGNRNEEGNSAFNIPEGIEFPGGNMEMPEGFEMPDGASGASQGSAQQMPHGSNWGNHGETSDRDANATRPDMSGMQFPDFENMGSTNVVSTESLVLLAASLGCLLAGMLVAYKYKR